MTYFYLSIGLIVIAFAIVFAYKNRHTPSKWISCIMVGIFFTTFFMLLPTEWVKADKAVFNEPLYSVVSSLLYSFKTIGGRQDISQLETIRLAGWLKPIYIGINYLSFILAPVLTSSLILSFLGDTGEKIRYKLRFTSRCCVFSEINENSLTLASGIKNSVGWKTIVFCNTKNTDKDLISKAREIGAILLYKSCKDMKISRRFKKHEFYLLSDNEDDNIELAEAIIAKKKSLKKRSITVNAFAQSGTNINVLEHLMKKTPCAVFERLTNEFLEKAEAVLAENPQTKIVFCDAGTAQEEISEYAKQKNFILIQKPWKKAKFKPLYSDYDITLYFEAKDKSIKKTSLKLYRNKLSDKWVDEPLKLSFIDEIALFCNNLLFEHPLYTLPGGRKDISVMIVGCGRLGMRMLKTVVWCGQIEGYSLKISVYDKNAMKTEQEFYAQCPELDSYGIKFIEADVENADFENKISQSLDATFVCIATGSDDLNLSTADNLYRIFRKNNLNYTPPIFTRIRKNIKSENFHNKGSYLTDRNISLFGTVDSIFSNTTLFNSRLENLALAVHLCYCWALDKPQESFEYKEALHSFYTSEYNRRSSMAAALHISSKLRSCNIITDEQVENGIVMPDEENLKNFEILISHKEEVFDKLSSNEHARWNAFVRSEGYRGTDFETVKKYAKTTRSHKDDASKQHPCILSWDELDLLQAQYNDLADKLGIKKSDFKEYDRKLVKEIPAIIRKANQLNNSKA